MTSPEHSNKKTFFVNAIGDLTKKEVVKYQEKIEKEINAWLSRKSNRDVRVWSIRFKINYIWTIETTWRFGKPSRGRDTLGPAISLQRGPLDFKKKKAWEGSGDDLGSQYPPMRGHSARVEVIVQYIRIPKKNDRRRAERRE